MNYNTYAQLLKEAKNYKDLRTWVAAYGYPADCPYAPSELLEMLQIIYEASHEDIKALVSHSRSMAAFSRRFCVPYSTVDKWCDNLFSPHVAMIYLIGFALINDIPTEQEIKNE